MLQFAENVNPIGIVLCVKTPSGICYRTSDWEISPCVMNPTVTGHMSWMLSLWWRPERRTAAIHVLSFPKASRFLVSESDFTYTAYGMRSSWAGWYPRHCWKPTISKFFFSRHRNVPLFEGVFISDEMLIVSDTFKRPRHWLSPRDLVTYHKTISTHIQDNALSGIQWNKWYNMMSYHKAKLPLWSFNRSKFGKFATGNEAEATSIS